MRCYNSCHGRLLAFLREGSRNAAEARTLVNEGTHRVEQEIDNVKNRLDRIDENSDKLEEQLRTVLKANTDAIVDLKIQVASLTQTIEALSEKINKLKEN